MLGGKTYRRKTGRAWLKSVVVSVLQRFGIGRVFQSDETGIAGREHRPDWCRVARPGSTCWGYCLTVTSTGLRAGSGWRGRVLNNPTTLSVGWPETSRCAACRTGGPRKRGSSVCRPKSAKRGNQNQYLQFIFFKQTKNCFSARVKKRIF